MTKKLHIVEGTSDILFAECKFKREIEAAVMGGFLKFGYFELETPTFEYDSVFSASEPDGLYRLIDRNGDVLSLRPDMTMPIARVAATKLNTRKEPVRASYLANVFRYQDTHKGGRQNEFTQAGIELLGVSGARYDAEIIACAVSALLECGVSEFMVELGDVNFIRGLLSEAKLPADKINQINALMTKKDTLAIEEILEREQGMSEDLKKLFIKLPSLFGNADIIDRILETSSFLGETSINALKNLKEIILILSYYKYDKYVSVDLAMNKNMDYYTGMIFKIFTRNIGFPIAGGGRYDKLTENFGENIPATGAAIYINRLIDGIIGSKELKEPRIDQYIKEADLKTAIEKAQQARKKGGIAIHNS